MQNIKNQLKVTKDSLGKVRVRVNDEGKKQAFENLLKYRGLKESERRKTAMQNKKSI